MHKWSYPNSRIKALYEVTRNSVWHGNLKNCQSQSENFPEIINICCWRQLGFLSFTLSMKLGCFPPSCLSLGFILTRNLWLESYALEKYNVLSLFCPSLQNTGRKVWNTWSSSHSVSTHTYFVLRKLNNSEIEQGQQWRHWAQREQLLNDIQQSQQLVDHWEMLVRASCFQLLAAAVLLLGTTSSGSHKHWEKNVMCQTTLRRLLNQASMFEGCGEYPPSLPLKLFLLAQRGSGFPICAPLQHPWVRTWSRSYWKHMPTFLSCQII